MQSAGVLPDVGDDNPDGSEMDEADAPAGRSLALALAQAVL
jgi:hypothetical protein